MPAHVNTLTQTNGKNNKIHVEDLAAHDWYRFVLSFPPHLVRQYLEKFNLNANSLVLDPFCGTGTTLVECKKLLVPSVGIEAHPMACFASRVKTNWQVNPRDLLNHAVLVANIASRHINTKCNDYGKHPPSSLPIIIENDLKTLIPDTMKLLLTNSISPIPLHKTLNLLEAISFCEDATFSQYERLALAKTLVFDISNLEFGPEVGLGTIKEDYPVVSAWLDQVKLMSNDLESITSLIDTPTSVITGDSRNVSKLLQPQSIDAVITSPPYPNEKDYTRTTRLESVLLGFIRNKAELRLLKQTLLRSNTRGVYKGDSDDLNVANHAEVNRIANQIETRRIELGKTSGFERLYSKVTKLYFGGMSQHLADLRFSLRPGAKLAYVVGDQASYLRVMIRTGQILSDIAESLGYQTMSIDLFRTRLSTSTKEQLREEVVNLRWPG